MSGVHLASGSLVVGMTVLLIGVAGWSLMTSRSSEGRRDHRRAVDRWVLVVFCAFIAAAGVGLASLIAGPGPSDGLHLLYGVAGPLTLVVAIVLSRIRSGWARRHTDIAFLVAAVLLLGIEARLFMTG